MATAFLALVSFIAVGMALVVYGTIAKNRWGINLAEVSCPRCNKLLPRLRRPQSRKQALWGGSTCPNCGAEVDKWGREVPTAQRCAEAEHIAGEMKRPTPLVFFSICAVVDFALGCIRGHSVGSGVLAIVFGLPLTGLLYLVFKALWKGKTDDSGVLHS